MHGTAVDFTDGTAEDMDAIAECDIPQAVAEAVANEQVIDLHTHLFPPSHGRLMLWGCDALLTYHYLVAEYFISALDPPSPEVFYRSALPCPCFSYFAQLFSSA
jgi:hypothetical protein